MEKGNKKIKLTNEMIRHYDGTVENPCHFIFLIFVTLELHKDFLSSDYDELYQASLCYVANQFAMKKTIEKQNYDDACYIGKLYSKHYPDSILDKNKIDDFLTFWKKQ